MPGIVGMGTTFNLPNFVGEIYNISPEDTPFLTAIGGLTGGRQAITTEWEWQYYDLRDASDRTRVEGADAPVAEERVRANASNVVEIHQEAVEISYSRLAARGALSTSGAGTNPITDEEAWQLEQSQKQIARDIEWSFMNGTYQKPSDNTIPRKTRGILAAIATNITDAQNAELSESMFLDAVQDAYDAGGFQESETRTIVVNSTLKRAISWVFMRSKGILTPMPQGTIAGARVDRLETDFGTFNIMMTRMMPANTILIASLEELAPVHLLVPGKGFLFVEPLAKTGAAERSQIYGEVGLEYGNERHHAKIVNVTAPSEVVS